MYDDVSALSSMQMDALREIGNIGAGSSATALSQIVGKRIEMNVPRVSIVELTDVPDLVGGPDVMTCGVFLRVYGKAPSNILFLTPIDSAFYLVDMLMGKPRGETQKSYEQNGITAMEESALIEIGNILSGAYLNALFNFTQIALLPSVPALCMDMAGAILSVVLIQLGQMGDHALVLETEFETDEEGIKGHFFLVPDPGSMETILSAVGV